MAEGAKKKLGPGRHLSAMKRHRQDESRGVANKGARAAVRSSIKKLLQAIEAKDAKAAPALFIQTQSLIDRAIKRGLYKSGTGHRTLSRLNRRMARIAS